MWLLFLREERQVLARGLKRCAAWAQRRVCRQAIGSSPQLGLRWGLHVERAQLPLAMMALVLSSC